MSQLRIEAPVEHDDHIELAATFVGSAGAHRLWYRVEKERARELGGDSDPFVIATIHQAMSVGEPLDVEGRVSPSLLANLEQFQQAWSAWKPDHYRPVEIRAEVENEPDLPQRTEAISCFSGGVDSCFTAYRHVKGVTTRHPLPLRAAVMVQGFDIPIDDASGYRLASERAQRQVGSLGLPLYRVITNFRQQPINWIEAYATGVASVMALFQRRFRSGLIAQGVPYSAYHTLTAGSNPLSDPLLSSGAFAVVPDGAGFQRTDKVAAIAAWEQGLADLRVCARNKVRYENCCTCEKCIRNILTFRALGVEPPPSLRREVTEHQILALVPIKEIKLNIAYEPIAAAARSRGLAEAPWARAVIEAIRQSRSYHAFVTTSARQKAWRLARRIRRIGWHSLTVRVRRWLSRR